MDAKTLDRLNALAEKWEKPSTLTQGFTSAPDASYEDGKDAGRESCADDLRELLAELTPKGVWMIYDHDWGTYVMSLHDNVEDATREVARQGYGKVGFWPLGMQREDAVKAWESRD